ncbi:uncharacterized protein LOC129294213 isoform X1 [Prosopis cineraria]|uniref:uncharacterized protein LOC129294213 isoform X1 n=1 Tax=Prosopis cineraria TaxID=364024 RepID=UPI00241077F4|nr:uncharacterized protein LOC129294213 isoform X1 [Prosopis cineraria]
MTSPEKIKGTQDSAIENFGIPQYGGSMAGNIVCLKENHKGCTKLGDSFKTKPGALPTILLLDRGKYSKPLADYLENLPEDEKSVILKKMAPRSGRGKLNKANAENKKEEEKDEEVRKVNLGKNWRDQHNLLCLTVQY